MKDKENIIEEYKDYAALHWTASREGDYKTANKNYAKLTKIFKILSNSQKLQEETMPRLLNDNDFCVQVWAAAHCLSLGVYQTEAIFILENVSEMSASEAPSFEAKMTLKAWKEQGKLTF